MTLLGFASVCFYVVFNTLLASCFWFSSGFMVLLYVVFNPYLKGPWFLLVWAFRNGLHRGLLSDSSARLGSEVRLNFAPLQVQGSFAGAGVLSFVFEYVFCFFVVLREFFFCLSK